MTDLCTFDQIGPDDRATVGGKGLSLARMAAAGLPVPPGFCVTCAAYRRLRGQQLHAAPELVREIDVAYQALGGGAVAVRSSATAEDGSVSSFAGQQETVLGVVGTEALLDAVAHCWASLDSERAVGYRKHLGVDESGLAMAVVVQRLVPAEVAGVLFTRDPLDPEGKRMLVEASWGLGESVVSGRVTPDRFQIERATGAVCLRQINPKTTELTVEGLHPVPAERQTRACLDDSQLKELAELGRRVEALYGDPRDVEWAWAEGRFWLLQARPITTVGAAEREQVRQEEIATLRERAEPTGTVWARFNLAEVLPEPMPMTWAIVRRFMSGRGGFGLMYRDLGFDPDPALDEEGVFDLVCGRPYCNLSREPRLHYRLLPFEHPFAVLKADPQKALYPTPVPNPGRGGWRFWLFLPITLVRLMAQMAHGERIRKELGQSFPRRFREEIVPAYLQEVEAEAKQDFAVVESAELVRRLEQWIRRALYDFARDSLKPTALAALLMGSLEQKLAKPLGPERARAALRDLVMGVRPDAEADLAAAVRDVAAGRMDRATFLQRFGHRGSQEMELSRPRWAEDATALDRLFAGPSSIASTSEKMDTAEVWARVADEAKLPEARRATLKEELDRLHVFLGLRDTAKHYLMKGYALIRRFLVELDRRYSLYGDVFFLTPEELPRLIGGEDFSSLITERKRQRMLALSLELPQVLFSDDLEAIGQPVVVAGAETLQGVPLSAGVAEAPALVLDAPTSEVPGEPYVLVCPSTDPAWVPLFVGARGLVMETGGVLSHGAIVAREFGLPAVAGIADVHRRLKTGQRLRVDGNAGTVTVLDMS
jgi:rifampicin phosphotransferase